MAEPEKKKKPEDLDQIVADLDPEKVNEKVVGHDKARETYVLDKFKVKNYQEFREQLIKYMKHHYKHKETYNTTLDDDRAFAKAHDILDQALKKEGGFVGAYKKAKKGEMKDLLDLLAASEKEDHKENYITSVMKRISPDDTDEGVFDQRVGIVKKVMDVYGKLLPKGIKKRKPEALAHQYEGFIKMYQNAVNQAKEVVGGEKEKEKSYKAAA
jgi:hypothetical protein